MQRESRCRVLSSGGSSTYPTAFDEMFGAGVSSTELNRLKILVDGDKLVISGINVDLDGIGTLRKMLEKYEEILKLQEGQS
jgi:hypothetical protein